MGKKVNKKNSKQAKTNSNYKAIIFMLVCFVLALVILFGGINYMLKGTYSAGGNYTVKFYRAEGNELLKTCVTDANGKLDSDCNDVLKNICLWWYPNSCGGHCTDGLYNYDESLKISTKMGEDGKIGMLEKVFTADTNYYCGAGSSQTEFNSNGLKCYRCDDNDKVYKWATNGNADNACSSGYTPIGIYDEEFCVTDCYVCKDDKNIMKWGMSGNSDSVCASGYERDTTKNKSECKTITPTPMPDNGCYVCKNDTNVMKWSTNGNADSACASGYTKDTTKNQSQCKTITPTPKPESGCYVCKNDTNVMKWSTNGNADSACTGGYTKDTTKNQSQCKTVVPEPESACYVCKTNDSIFKWTNSSVGDTKCPNGYNKTNLSKDNCVFNPPTSGSGALIATLIEIAALLIIASYLKDTVFKKKKIK